MGKISTSTWYDAPSIVTTMHRCKQTIFTINLKNLRSSAREDVAALHWGVTLPLN